MCAKEDVYLKSKEEKNLAKSLDLPDFVPEKIRLQFKK